jgi:hypothetical protein
VARESGIPPLATSVDELLEADELTPEQASASDAASIKSGGASRPGALFTLFLTDAPNHPLRRNNPPIKKPMTSTLPAAEPRYKLLTARPLCCTGYFSKRFVRKDILWLSALRARFVHARTARIYNEGAPNVSGRYFGP